ncbi:hypothetical protein ES705_14576 [subsurface metagenome]
MGFSSLGVMEFLKLVDTPASFAGQGLKAVRIKATEDLLEFAAFSKFTLSQVFDGATATPSSTFFIPYTLVPYWAIAYDYTLQEYGAIIINNNLYVFGGQRKDDYSFFNQCHRFNLTTQRWEKLANLPHPARGLSSRCGNVSHNNGKIYWCAIANTSVNYLYEYTIASDTWASYVIPTEAGSIASMVCCACTDYCYVHTKWSANYMYRFDYGVHDFTPRTTPVGASQLSTWGKIGDELYLCHNNGGALTSLYDKGANTWSNTGQDHPTLIGHNGGGSYVEDENALWAMQYNDTTFEVYRYTLAGGWITLFTNTRNQREADSVLVPAGYTTNLAFFTWGMFKTGSQPFAGGTIAKYSGSGAWTLYSGTFAQGDLIIIHESGGIPVHIEKDGVLLVVCDGMNLYYVIEAGTYMFTLSKDYDFTGVGIYKSVWG